VILFVVVLRWTNRITGTILDRSYPTLTRWSASRAMTIAQAYRHSPWLAKACKVSGAILLVVTVTLIASASSTAGFLASVTIGLTSAGIVFSVGVAIDHRLDKPADVASRVRGSARVIGSDGRFRYGGPWFWAASLPLEGATSSERLASLTAASLRRPRRLVALLVLVLRTRSERVRLSGSLAGRTLHAFFNARSLGVFPRHRLCRGVLFLPEDHSEYLRGRRRQALRTNLRRAVSAGISCEVASDRSRVLDDILEIDRRGSLGHDTDVKSWRAALAMPEFTVMVARNERGNPLAFAGVVIDEAVCLISVTGAISHEARWALHDYLVQILIAHRVRYLIASGGGPFGALGYPANVQQYQHLLGYELRHVSAVAPRAVRRGKRSLPTFDERVTAATRQPIPSAVPVSASSSASSQSGTESLSGPRS
jgi:hypothetical protein